MNFFILITSILLVLPVQSRTIFECPLPDSIHPCTCTSNPSLVKCNNVDSLDIVRDALTGRFREPLPLLEITNFGSLPKQALGDIRVKKLKLTDSDIIDIQDEAFDGQDSLKLLRLSNDHLTDIPTEALKRLPRLRDLNLEDNYITKIGVNSFGVESRIGWLDLNKNSLSTIEMGAFPRSLLFLTLTNNHLSTLNGSLLNTHSLQNLKAGGNKLNSIRGEFRGLTQLYFLSLERNDLTSIEGAFDDLISLTMLNLANNRLQDLEGLLPLKNLRWLKVADNQITSLGDNTFSSLNRLTDLDLSGNRISHHDVCDAFRALRKFQKLQDLRLSNMGLTFLSSNCLKGLKDLVVIDLSLNALTNTHFVTGESFPRLGFLTFKCNFLRELNHGLENLPYLYELDISFNRFVNLMSSTFFNNTFLTIIIEGNIESLVKPAQCDSKVHIPEPF